MLSPPTDSLYKFIAITGLVMLIWGVSFPWSKGYELRLQTQELAATIEAHAGMAELLRSQSQALAQQIEQAREDRLAPAELELLRTRQRDIQLKLLESQRPIDVALGQLEVLEEANATYRWIGQGSLLGGILLMLAGFYFWYSRIQRYLDREARQRR